LAKIINDIHDSPKLKEKANWLFSKFKPMLAYFRLFREDFDEYELADIKHLIMTINN